jgi:DNA-binding PadR family transcriptional regulator
VNKTPRPPLKPFEFLVLTAVAGAERHPYAIKKHLERSDLWGRVVGAGTLYRVIGQLLDAGLITESSSRPRPELDDERRTYYRLTTLGQRVVRAEARRLTDLAANPAIRRLAREA